MSTLGWFCGYIWFDLDTVLSPPSFDSLLRPMDDLESPGFACCHCLVWGPNGAPIGPLGRGGGGGGWRHLETAGSETWEFPWSEEPLMAFRWYMGGYTPIIPNFRRAHVQKMMVWWFLNVQLVLMIACSYWPQTEMESLAIVDVVVEKCRMLG